MRALHPDSKPPIIPDTHLRGKLEEMPHIKQAFEAVEASNKSETAQIKDKFPSINKQQMEPKPGASAL
jgi:uncharacterized protein YdeI (YjbR/CyaY-like superfamily)